MTQDPHDRTRYLVRPVTVVMARYPFENKGWLALPCEPWDVPRDIFDDENTAFAWYENAGLMYFQGEYGGVTAAVPVGIGATPSTAYDDLGERIAALQPVRIFNTSAREPSYLYEISWPGGQTTLVGRDALTSA
jgi:hypothetical protein